MSIDASRFARLTSSFRRAPSPIVVARRYAEVAQEPALNPDKLYRAAVVQGAGYAVSKGQGADIAAVALRRHLPGRDVVHHAPIGHLNPATQEWNLYGEYVRRRERRGVVRVLDAVTPAAVSASEQLATRAMPYIDIRNPLTQQVRTEMTVRLGQLPLQGILDKGLREAGITSKVTVDGATTYYPTIATRLYGPTHLLRESDVMDPDDFVLVPEGALLINYMGTRHAWGGRHSARGRVSVCVADNGPGGWTPNLHVVSRQDWGVAAGIPTVLDEYRDMHPMFSHGDCAVVFDGAGSAPFSNLGNRI